MAIATVPRPSANSFIAPPRLENIAAQLSSLLMLIYGNGMEAFNCLHETHRDQILWLASDLACEINDIIQGA